MQIEKAEKYIMDRLRRQLAPELHYHDYDHTAGVVDSAMRIAGEEGIEDRDHLLILRTAALFHDSGFLLSYDKHEEASCSIVENELPSFGYTVKQIRDVNALIMKTKVPQQPGSILEYILCDADLDHLGRNDFEEKGKKLYREWYALGKVKGVDEYNQMQIRFLESHHYWTASSRKTREPKKAEHLRRLRELCNQK